MDRDPVNGGKPIIKNLSIVLSISFAAILMGYRRRAGGNQIKAIPPTSNFPSFRY
jgi:hypothetical protein